MRISTRISLAFLATAVALTVAASLVSYTAARGELEEQIFGQLETAAGARADHVRSVLEANRRAFRLLAMSPALERAVSGEPGSQGYGALLREAAATVRDRSAVCSHVVSMQLLNDRGTVVVSTGGAAPGTVRDTDAVFLSGREGLYLGDVHREAATGRVVMEMAGPVPAEGRAAGVLVATHGADELYRILEQRTGLGLTGEVYLVNRDGFMMSPSRFEPEAFLKRRVDTEAVRQCLGRARPDTVEVSVYRDYRGVPVVGASVYLAETGWCLLAEVDRREAFAPLAASRRLFMTVILLVPLAAWLVGSAVSRVIIGPLRKLHEGVEKVGKGDLDHKVSVKAPDEIGQLSAAFDRMTDDLKKRTTSITRLEREIDERRRVQHDLVVMSSAIESSITLIAIADLEGTVTYVNRSFLRAWGYRGAEDVVGKPATFFWQGEEAAAGVMELARRKGGWTGELRLRRKDGTAFDAYVSASTVSDEAGNPLCMMVSFTDITERKRADEALRESEERFRTLVSNLPGVVYRCALDPDWTMSFISHEIRDLVGYPPSDFLDNRVRSYASVIHPDDRDAVERTVREGVSGKSPYVIEYRVVHASGEERWVYEKGQAVFDRDDRVQWLDGAIFDISQRKRAEQAVREAMTLKSSFISTVSHELRTPLTAIKEGIDIIADGSAGPLTEQQTEFLGIATSNVDRLTRLINDVLDFQKIDSGKVHLDVRENDMNAVVREVHDTMMPLAQEKGLALVLELDDALPSVRFDKDKMIQVLTNIIDNGIKFTDEGCVTARTTHRGNIIQVMVEDTGRGIKAEDMPRLFQHFEQIGHPKPGGTGLGLAICKEIVDRHRGKIWAESVPGEGATFCFLLPIKERRRAAAR